MAQNRLEYSRGLIRCVEIAPKGIRVNIVDTIRTSVTLLKSALHSRIRLRNSSAVSTRPYNDAPEAEPPHKIQTIFSGPHFARETRGAQE